YLELAIPGLIPVSRVVRFTIEDERNLHESTGWQNYLLNPLEANCSWQPQERSRLFGLARLRFRRRFLGFHFPGFHFLRFPRLIIIDRGADKIFQRPLIDLVALEKVNRAPLIAFQARVEELFGIGQACPFIESQLHLAFVGIGNRDDSIARPHRAAHPLPFFDDLAVSLEDELAKLREGLAAPVSNSRDQLIDAFRWIHGVELFRKASRLLLSKTSKDRAGI